MKVKLTFLGVVVGFVFGFISRPTLMGVKLPLDLLTSTNPIDAPFKSELMQHLFMTTGMGAAAGFALALVIVSLNTKQGGAKAEKFDSPKWSALVELDPDIAEAAMEARSRDAECEAFLAQKYMVLADKNYLEAALKQALADFDLRERRRKEMAAVEIHWTSIKRIQGIEFRHGEAISRRGKSIFTVQGDVWSIHEGHLAGSYFHSEAEFRSAIVE